MRISDWSSDVCSSDLRIPVKSRELFERVELQAVQAPFAIGHHIVGEHGVGEHRDVAEDVVKDVGFLQIVEMLRRADEIARSEERRVGKECVSTCRYRESACP